MSRFMRNGFMASMGAITAVGLGICIWQDAGGVLSTARAELGLGGAGGESVLVIFVSSAGAVADVRAVVADERIVAESPQAFAVREGRIIADGRESAGDIVSAAGWVERDLKLMRVRTKATRAQAASTGKAGEGGLAPEKLAELLSRDTWTHAEATLLLDHI
jgi:hypothetical protein